MEKSDLRKRETIKNHRVYWDGLKYWQMMQAQWLNKGTKNWRNKEKWTKTKPNQSTECDMSDLTDGQNVLLTLLHNEQTLNNLKKHDRNETMIFLTGAGLRQMKRDCT